MRLLLIDLNAVVILQVRVVSRSRRAPLAARINHLSRHIEEATIGGHVTIAIVEAILVGMLPERGNDLDRPLALRLRVRDPNRRFLKLRDFAQRHRDSDLLQAPPNRRHGERLRNLKERVVVADGHLA